MNKHNPSFISNPLIKGTLLLSCSGIITRIIGFINRIFLSQLIGPKEMGIYQLIFPVYMIAFALCCHGMELALSQMTASFFGQTRSSSANPQKSPHERCHILVKTGCALSLSASLFFSTLIYLYAEQISIFLLKEQSCAVCLRLMAPVLPFTALRCCLHGYYFGRKKTAVPSASQLIEQIVRVFIIWLIAASYPDHTFTAALAVCGMVTGEIAATLYIFINYKFFSRPTSEKTNCKRQFPPPYGKELLKRALPLTGNKLSLTLASSLESVLIPAMLTLYYKDSSLALSIYGILTGMALPFITFPATLTNSLSVMLLPTISEAHAKGNGPEICRIIKKTVKLCLTLGFTALLLFFFFGKQIGLFIFQEQSAGDFLFILSFLCPFLYLSSSGTSILNGLNQMKQNLCYNMFGIFVRILFILLAIPRLGIQGYLLGLLAAYLLQTILQWNRIKRILS